MNSIVLIVVACCSQLPRATHVPLSNHTITVSKDRFPPDVEVTEFVHKISPEDIWQTAPYCGVNAVFLMLELNNISASYSTLKKQVPTTLSGASLLDLRNVAQSNGLSTEVIKTTPSGITDFSFPLIALLGPDTRPEGNGHYIVVCNVSDGYIAALDGTTGNLDSISRDVFNKMFSGYVLVRRDRGMLDVASYTQADVWLGIGCALNLVVALTLALRPSRRMSR